MLKISKIVKDSPFLSETVLYLIGLLLSLITLFWSLDLPLNILDKPLSLGGDAYPALAWIKSTVDNGSYLNNPFLSAPWNQEFYDFPIAEQFNFTLIKLLYLLCQKQLFLTSNVYYILTFVLTTLSSIYVLRKIGISKPICLALSLLYSFLPYHFLRGLGLQHFFLSAYYSVPLGILVSLWLSENSISFSFEKGLFSKENRNLLVSIVFLIIIGSSGVYYAFFTFLILCFSLLYRIFLERRLRKRLMYVFLILSISLNLSFLANILPNILYTMANGENLEVANRGINESEVYALKIIHLILPQYISRLGFLKSLTGRYLNSSMPLQNENTSSSLGIVLSIGFVTLLVNILLNNSSAQSKFLHPGFVRIFRYISSLNLYILLFSTVGGLGSIFALTISPQIRAWNRISVFIAFLAVMATSILLESAYYRFVKSGFHKICFYTLCVLIFYVGILDQTSLQFIPSYTDFENGFYNDQKFISTIESSLKPYSMVFQLPYVPYPEAGSLAKIGDYDHMRGYLHSKYLRWSYGSVRGREPSNWQKSISSEPIDEVLVKKLSVVGFDGIYIDRYGYEDNGRQIQSDFIEILKDYPLEDDQKRFMFFNIQDFKEKYIETLKVDREMCKDIALAKPMITFDTGFYAIETDGKDNWRWSNQTGQIKLTNSTKQERSVTMGMEVASGSSTPSSLKVYTDDGDYESNITTISGTPTEYSITLTLKPMHETIINFESNAQQVESLDTRIMFFRLLNFTFTFSDPKEQKCW